MGAGNRHKGISLVEVIVSFIILGAGLLGTLALMSNLYSLNKRLGYYYTAYNLAREPIEFVESVHFQHTNSTSVSYSSGKKKYIGDTYTYPALTNLNKELEELNNGTLASPKLLPPRPESLFMQIYVFMYYHNRSPEAEIYYVPKSVLSGADCAVGQRCKLGKGIAYVNSFVSWKDADGKRKGVALGVIPFRYYNGTSNTVAMRIDKMTIE